MTATTRDDIANLLSRWCWAMDDRDLEAVAACWADDAVLHTTLPGREPQTVQGRDAIVGRLAAAWERMPPAGVHHILTTLLVEQADSETATVRTCTVSLRLRDGAPAFSSLGTHRDVLVKVDGDWRIRVREQTVEGWTAAS
ncbi:nuclear transport factor 2 family protein [Pseudonocardia pini]|uniref:nuclear transport factor 2 family protein n=1 Tax=Pseudonocardia pini TaxID=2758030 RepID=UPI0015F00438|nr:nuclear transport factor 2 family protein [Pseudonocardia pini]